MRTVLCNFCYNILQNFFHWPRSGKRGDAEMCCDGLIAYMNDDDIFNTVCNAPQCCDGYEEKIKRPHNSKNIFFVCVRSEVNNLYFLFSM